MDPEDQNPQQQAQQQATAGTPAIQAQVPAAQQQQTPDANDQVARLQEENRILNAAREAGVAIPADVDIIEWGRVNVGRTDGGQTFVLAPADPELQATADIDYDDDDLDIDALLAELDDDYDDDDFDIDALLAELDDDDGLQTQQQQALAQVQEPAPNGLTQTQQAVLVGNPNLPAGIHRQVMNPVGGRSLVDDIDNNLDQMHDENFRKGLWKEIHDSEPGSLRKGLVENTARVFDRGVYANNPTHDIKQDLFS